MKTLNELFLDQLGDMYDSEQRIIKALPKLIKAATCTELQAALQSHLQETEGHAEKLERVFECFGEKAKGQKCHAIVGILDESDEMVSDNKGSPTINAAIIAAGQKVEHYEIATYGCLHAWALQLGNEEAAGLIQEILNQEKGADQALNHLSMEKNREAMGEDAGNEAAGGRSNEPGRQGTLSSRTTRRDSALN